MDERGAIEGEAEGVDDAFRVWVSNQPTRPGQMGSSGIVLKRGPRVVKTLMLSTFGNEETGEVRRRVLRAQTCPLRPGGVGYDFDNPAYSWSCENEEADALIAFLAGEVPPVGRYRLLRIGSPAADLLAALGENVDIGQLAEALNARVDTGDLVKALASSEAGLTAAEGAVVAQRRGLVAGLRTMVSDPITTETDLQRAVGDAYWLFGGRYVGVAPRRTIAPRDEYDIPLIGADGTLHIIELKGSHVPKLVRKHRSHWIVGNDVHEAVSQSINYLRTLDGMGASLQQLLRESLNFDVDLLRVFATVVIGAPEHVADHDADPVIVEQTIRSYNSHLSRVQVVTYAALLQAAEQSLAFENRARPAHGATLGSRDASSSGAGAPDPWAAPDPWSTSAPEPPF